MSSRNKSSKKEKTKLLEEIRKNEIKAIEFKNNGQYDEAIQLYEKNLSMGIYSEYTCRGLWGCYRRRDDLEKSIETIKRIIKTL